MQPGKMARSAKRAGPKTQAPASGARRTLQPPPSPPLMKGNLGVAKALAKGPPGGALMHGMGLQTQGGKGGSSGYFLAIALSGNHHEGREICAQGQTFFLPLALPKSPVSSPRDSPGPCWQCGVKPV